MDTKNPDRSILIAFALAVLFAGCNGIAVKYSNAELPPFFGAAIRFGIASLILFLMVLVFRLKLPSGRSLQGAVIYGLIGTGVNYALIYWALEYLPAGLSMVILALVPLLTFLFAWAHGQEAFRWKAIIGACLAVVGIGIIAWSQLSTNIPVLPLFAVMGAAVCFAESTVMIKTYPQTHPITTNAVALFTGSILLFVFSLLGRETPILPSLLQTWIALGYLVIFGSVVTFVLTLFVLKNWTASASSYMFVLMPIITITVGAWLVHESVTLPLVAGGALVLSGTYIGGIANTDQWKCAILSFLARYISPVPECK